MKAEAFARSIDELYERLKTLTASKGEEYKRRDDNQFANFERGAASLGLTREQVLMVYLSKHLDSITTYVKDRAAGQEKQYAEPITGRIDDAILYLLLLRGMAVQNEAKSILDGLPRARERPRQSGEEVALSATTIERAGNVEVEHRETIFKDKGTAWEEARDAMYCLHNFGECPVDFGSVEPDPVREAFKQMAIWPGQGPTVGSPVFVVSRHQPDGVEECHARALPIATSCLSTVDQLHGIRPGAHVIFIHHGNSGDDAMLAEVRDRCHKQGLTNQVIYK